MLLSFVLFAVGMAGLSATAPVVFEPSYAELAGSLLPAQFNLAISQLQGSLGAQTQPDGVKTLRINLLKARELLDMFSYAYPNTTAAPSNGTATTGDDAGEEGSDEGGGFVGAEELERRRRRCSKDQYLQIREDLDRGYEVLGAFQDLAHSLVKYNDSDVEQYRAECLQWQDEFMSHLFLRTYTLYLASPDPAGLYDRSKLSKLFWGYKGAHPNLALSGVANMALLASSLLDEAADKLPAVLAMREIYAEPLHSQFHLYRKLIRSLVSVLESCPTMMSSESLRSVDRPWYSAVVGLFHRADSARGASRAFLRSLPVLSWSSRSLTAAPERAGAGPATGAAVYGLGCPAYEDFVKTLGKIFHDLGQVNNWIVSYDFYAERGMQAEAEDSRQRVLDMWQDVGDWMSEQDLPGQLSCISRALVSRWHLRA